MPERTVRSLSQYRKRELLQVFSSGRSHLHPPGDGGALTERPKGGGTARFRALL